MFEARKIKNEDEVECLRIASAIGEAMFQTMKEMVKPGVRESEIMGAMHKTAYTLGGEVYSGMLVTSGPFSWPNSRYMTDRILRPHDIVFADVYNTTYNGISHLLLSDLQRWEAAATAGGCLQEGPGLALQGDRDN